MSPLLFNLIIDNVVKKCRQKLKKYNVGYWKFRNIQITELFYSDDLMMFEESEKQRQKTCI